MGKRKPTAEVPPPELVVTREDAAGRILKQIAIGQELHDRIIQSDSELDRAQNERSKWSSYNSELLTRIFSNRSIVDEYNRFFGAVHYMNPTLRQKIGEFQQSVDDQVTRLEAIHGRLDLIPVAGRSAVGQVSTGIVANNDVFIVHGHNEAAKDQLWRFVEMLGLGAIVLRAKPNPGRTIIENFGDIPSTAGFAVILLTADDRGGPKSESHEDQQPRARQNVILELGFFLGRLGRNRVCALYEAGVEVPSDYQGVLFVKLDEGGAWRWELAREMKSAGMPIDMNRVI